MATGYSITTSEDIAVKRWSEALHQDMIFGEPLVRGAISDGILIENNDLSKGAGDKVTCNYATRIAAKGVQGDGAVRSQAEAITYVTDSLYIDKLTIPAKAKIKGSMTQQLVAFDHEAQTFIATSDWFKQRVILGLFKQLGGELATSLTYDGVAHTSGERKQITGIGQLPTAHTTYRKKFATGSADETVQADSSATLTLSAINTLYNEAKTQRAGVNNFKPLAGKSLGGLPYEYVFYVSTAGMSQLIADATANQLTYGTIVLNQISGGQTDAAAGLGRSFVFRFTKVVEVPDHYIPNGVHSSTAATQANVKRALFCGAEAATIAFGQGYQSLSGETVPGFTLVSDVDKIEDEVITKASGIIGIKKNVVNSYDYGVITYSHYVA